LRDGAQKRRRLHNSLIRRRFQGFAALCQQLSRNGGNSE
jgi:hypothetical protein